MPVTFDYDSSLKLLRTLCRGEFNDEVLRATARRSRELSVRLHPVMGITDMRQVEMHVSAEGARAAAHLTIAKAQNIPRVVVAPDNVAFGMARLYQMTDQDKRPRFQVVRTMEEAYRILGIEEEPQYDMNDL